MYAGITMSVRGGEKIGVVGRTGAGKSSLMLARTSMNGQSHARIPDIL
jgi:ATPase subunit of ABC transporter with duplicated ATPase domains